MTTFGTDQAEQVSAACATGAAEAAAALGRVTGGSFQLTPGAVQLLPAETPNAAWEVPGLVLVFLLGDVAAAAIVPESLLPTWYLTPDASGSAKLMTLAQEWGMLLLPEDRMPEDFRAIAVPNLASALEQAGLESAAAIPLQITGAASAEATLVWPLPNAAAIIAAERPAAPTAPAVEDHDDGLPLAPRAVNEAPAELAAALAALPPYIRSLLKIKVQLSVKLAETKLSVQRVLDLCPGSIIPFEKSCEESLSLLVGETEIALGEAVKSGDKFGLRIGSMVLPAERFLKLTTDSAPRRAG